MNTNDFILKMIEDNATVNEICNLTGLSHKQLFYRMNMLKLKGYEFEKKYYYDGEIVYKQINALKNEENNEKTIITSSKDTVFRAVLISDLHAGNIRETLNKVNDVYNFCVKNGYHIVFNIGDLIDSNNIGHINNKKILGIDNQINHLLDNYPYDKNILNFICLGNHDYNALTMDGISLHNILNVKRHDLISLGYGCGIINIKKDRIALRHPIEGLSREKLSCLSNDILLTGHSHKFKGKIEHNYSVYVPSLSNMKSDREEKLPSFLTISVDFKNGYFNVANYEQYSFVGDKLYKTAEIEQPIKRYVKNDFVIRNEENRKKIKLEEYKNIQKQFENYKRNVKALKKEKK